MTVTNQDLKVRIPAYITATNSNGCPTRHHTGSMVVTYKLFTQVQTIPVGTQWELIRYSSLLSGYCGCFSVKDGRKQQHILIYKYTGRVTCLAQIYRFFSLSLVIAILITTKPSMPRKNRHGLYTFSTPERVNTNLHHM